MNEPRPATDAEEMILAERTIARLRAENEQLRNELELARLALAKREPEPETYTIGGSK